MEEISLKEYQRLIKNVEVIEKDGFGLKVLDTKKGEMIKLFRRKRVFSTAFLKPYAARFADNAKRLTSLNIPTVAVNRLVWCPSIKRHLVIYKRLEGALLRDVLTKEINKEEVFKNTGTFIAELHEKGVYFRSAHFKNILVLPNGQWGLIDVSDMQIKRSSLGIDLRKRNFQHILRYEKDKTLVRNHFKDFFSSYLTASQLDENNAHKVEQTIRSILA